MRTDEMEIVCFALALHLEVDPSEIHESQHLEEDLGLDPLDLVLVVLRLEEIGEGEFPVGDLEAVFTVKDLADVVRSWDEGPPTVRVPQMRVHGAALAS
jgi:acyl carrier protein